ncbi:hypothetical protein Tco_1321660, partial [Tanacetum coccineum]
MSVTGCSLINQGFIPRTGLSNPIDLFNALALAINKAINGHIVKGIYSIVLRSLAMLVDNNRIPEVTLMAQSYLPSKVYEVAIMAGSYLPMWSQARLQRLGEQLGLYAIVVANEYDI